jgi:hypothetical protein
VLDSLQTLSTPIPVVFDRVLISLQGDKHRITTPINWIPGDDVIVHPSVKNEEAKTLFPNFRIVKPYLRFTPLPKEQTTAA